MHRAHETVELLKVEMPDFIPPNLWPPNSPDLNPVNYKIWGLLQEWVYKTSIKDVDELRCQLAEDWDQLDQCRIDKAVAEWQKRLRAPLIRLAKYGALQIVICICIVWLQIEDSLNTKCEQLSFPIFCIRTFRPNSWNTAVLFSKNWLFCWVQCALCATFCNCDYLRYTRVGKYRDIFEIPKPNRPPTFSDWPWNMTHRNNTTTYCRDPCECNCNCIRRINNTLMCCND